MSVDTRRRILLAAGVCAAGGIGVVGYMESRQRPPAGEPLTLDIATFTPGRLMTVEWKKHTVWVLHRSPEVLTSLSEREDQLVDPLSEHSLQPAYCRNRHRSLRPEFLVVLGECTHQGCTPQFSNARAPAGEFLCPCHTSKFDLAGRVFRNGPALTNLTIPEYRFEGPARLVIGAS